MCYVIVDFMATMFELTGDGVDLDGAARIFNSGYPLVEKKIDRYYLHIEGLHPGDEKGCLESAELAIARINAISFVRYGNHRRLGIKGLTTIDDKTGELRTKVSVKARIQARSRAYITPSINGKVVADSGAQNAFKSADSNEPLQRALYLYGVLEHNWVGLYMVYEAIREGDGNAGLLKKFVKQVDAFTGTANSQKALGKNARHGSTKSGYPSPQITLEESQELIRELLDNWIERLNTTA